MFIYHKALGFPRTLKFEEIYTLENVILSSHAREACYDDRYGNIKINTSINFSRKDIVEVESINNRTPTKFLIRIKYNDKLDINLAIQLEDKTIKTVWLNESSDRHITLNKGKYDKPQNQPIKIKF